MVSQSAKAGNLRGGGAVSTTMPSMRSVAVESVGDLLALSIMVLGASLSTMSSVQFARAAWPSAAMRQPVTLTPEKAEDAALGRALKALRESRDPRVTQSDAADAAGITLQAWQNYEAGKRRFTEALINTVTRAIDVTRDDLFEERDRQLYAPEAAVRPRFDRPKINSRLEIPIFGRARAGAQGPHIYDVGQSEGTIDLSHLLSGDTYAMRAVGESMVPYLESGAFVIYHKNRWPKRGKGCVIETKSGEYFVKRYERTDGSTLFVTELFPEERELRFKLSDVAGVYAIGMRED